MLRAPGRMHRTQLNASVKTTKFSQNPHLLNDNL